MSLNPEFIFVRFPVGAWLVKHFLKSVKHFRAFGSLNEKRGNARRWHNWYILQREFVRIKFFNYNREILS